MTERTLTSAAGALAPEDGEAEQLGLFEAPLTPAGQAHPRNQKRGAGRPVGARNKRTERSIAFLLGRHRDPREVLLEIAESNVFDLAALLGCKPFEALQEKRLAAIGVLPYVAARITPEVIDNRGAIHLAIYAGGAELAGAAGGAGLVAAVVEAVEYRPVEPAADPVAEPAADGSSAETSDEPRD